MTKRTNGRAVSTILGSAVFLVLFVAGFTVFIFALEVTGDRFSEQLSASFAESIRAKESFTIHPSIDTGDTLFIELFNTGSVPVNALHAYMVNQSDGTIFNYEINFKDGHVAPNERRALLANYVEGVGIDSILDIPKPFTYDVKVVSEVGTIAIQELTVPLDPFEIDLFTIPKNLGTGQDVTIAMIVYNRGDNSIDDVTPTSTGDGMTTPSTAIQGSTSGPFPDPSSGITLEPEESVLFTWEQTVIGAIGTLVTYTNGVQGTDPASGDTVTSTSTDTDSVEFVPQAVSLLQKPELTFLISSPSGESGKLALWGMNVINPTDTAITVSRVIFTASSNDGDVHTFPSGNCDQTDIAPGDILLGSWDCPAGNVLMWSAVLGNEISIPGRNSQAFVVTVTAGDIDGQNDDPATLITGTAYTSFGATTDIAAATGTIDGINADGAIVALFGSNTATAASIIDGSQNLVTSTVIGNITGQDSGSNFDLILALASLGDGDSAGVKQGNFIINIPAGFTVNSTADDPSDACGTLVETPFADGSTQITCDFTDLGTTENTMNSNFPEAMTIKINLTAPNATANALYIIVALAEGITETATSPPHPVGPVLEFPIQVLELP